MKCMEFSSLFLRVLYYTPNLICSLNHLPILAVQGYFISYLFIFHDFKSDMMRLCNEQTKMSYTYFPKKVPVCGKSDILI